MTHPSKHANQVNKAASLVNALRRELPATLTAKTVGQHVRCLPPEVWARVKQATGIAAFSGETLGLVIEQLENDLAYEAQVDPPLELAN